MLGLELEDTRAIAVRIDDLGAVQARSTVDASGDLSAAAQRALESVTPEGQDRAVLGLAAVAPDAAHVASIAAGLASRLAGSFGAGKALPSGTAAAVAEAWVGAARGANDVVFFSCGEHAAGGIVRGGAPVVGARGRAATIAWLALNPVEREDYRKVGCLEAEVAAAGIVRRLIWRVKAGDHSRVHDAVGGDFAAITAQHVLDAAREGDGVSISVVRDTAKYLGMAAANLVAVTDPEVLVLGGVMASAADLLFEPTRAEIGRRLPKPMMDALRIETAVLGADAPAIGAARLAALASR